LNREFETIPKIPRCGELDLKTRKSTNLVNVLKFRANKHLEELREDMKLLEKLLAG
jgi:hypothetical protein